MPIRPENKGRYPKDWKSISLRVRLAANNRCAGSPEYPQCRAENGQPHPETGSVVVLTVAHLDHRPENCATENLRAWCQRCHNTYGNYIHDSHFPFSYPTNPFALIAEKVGAIVCCHYVGLGQRDTAVMQEDLTMKPFDLGWFPEPAVNLDNLLPFGRFFLEVPPAYVPLERAKYASGFWRATVLPSRQPSIAILPGHPGFNQDVAIMDEGAPAGLYAGDFVERNANPAFDRSGGHIAARADAKYLPNLLADRTDFPISGAVSSTHPTLANVKGDARPIFIASHQRHTKRARGLGDVDWKRQHPRLKPRQMLVDCGRLIAGIRENRTVGGFNLAARRHQGNRRGLHPSTKGQDPQFWAIKAAGNAIGMKVKHRPSPICALSFSASLPPHSLAWVCRTAPCRQWRRERGAVWGLPSCDQPRVGQALPGHASDEAIQPLQGVAVYRTLIEPEGELIDIAGQMLRAGVVVDAMQTALENSPDAFDAVGSHAVADILTCAVVDRLMVKKQPVQPEIAAVLISVELRPDLDISEDRSVKHVRARIGNNARFGSAAALPHPDNGSLASAAATDVLFLVLMPVLFKPADIGFVDLDDPLQFGQVRTASLAKAMQDKPRRLLRDPDFLRQLHTGNPLAGGDQQIHRVNPLVQRDVAALEDGSGPHGEVLFALVAAIVAAFAGRDALTQATDRAPNAFRPKPLFKVGARRFLIRDHREQLKRRNGALAHVLSSDFSTQTSSFLQGSKVYNSHTYDMPNRRAGIRSRKKASMADSDMFPAPQKGGE